MPSETVVGTVLTGAIGGTGWQHFFQITVEYSSLLTVALSFLAADTDNNSYAPNVLTLPATGGVIAKYTTKVSAAKWKLLQLQFQSSDPALQVYLEGLVLNVKDWGSSGMYRPVNPFTPSGGEGGQS